jgi:hypothetical protein
MGLGKTLTMIALILRSKELRKDNEENITASPRGTYAKYIIANILAYVFISSFRSEEGKNPCCMPSKCPETVGVRNH